MSPRLASARTSRPRSRACASVAATASRHRRVGSGSSPRTTWDSRAPTTAPSRSPKCEPAGTRGSFVSPAVSVRPLAVDGLLETGAGREARHLRGRDLDRLARPWVDALTSAALGDMELAEPGERHIAAALQRLLDGVEDGVDCLAGLGLAQVRTSCDLIDEL